MISVAQQQVLDGYQQTEVGVIPDNWGVVKIGDICDISVGKDVDPNYSSEPDSKFCYPVYSNTVDVPGIYGYYDYPEYSGEVVTVVGRGVGLGTAICRSGGFGAIGRLVVLFPKREVSNKFLAEFINHRIDVFSESSGVPQLTGISLGSYCVAYPPAEEQTAIANALSDVDALITSLELLIAKKLSIKTAAMQQLLTGKTRLPPFDQAHTGYKQTELGEIPEDWEVKTVAQSTSNIIDYRGVTPLKLGMEWGGGDIRALSAGNVKKGYIDFKAESYFGSDALYKRWMRNGDARKGDIVFTMEAPLGNVAIIPDDRKYILSQRTILLQLDTNSVFNRYLYQYFLSAQFQSCLSDRATGSTAQGIKRAVFELLELPVPSYLEQEAISKVLTDMDEELDTVVQRLTKTQDIKQGMMQELLTGRTRLV